MMTPDLRPYNPGPVIPRQAGQCGVHLFIISTPDETCFTKFVISLIPTKYYLCPAVPSCLVVLVWLKWRKKRVRK